MVGSIISAANDVKQGYWQNAFNIFNAVQSLKSSRLSEKQYDLQKDAFEWQKNFDQNQTQIRVDDMAKAGLNPILAAGGSAGSSVSAQSVNSPQQSSFDFGFGQLSALKELDLQESQLKSQNKIAEESNETSKEVAETNAESAKEVAEINAKTAKINARLNAQTQTAIATANNEAQASVRSAQERSYNASSDKQEFENEYTKMYNELTGRLTTAKSVIEFLDMGSTQLASWYNIPVQKAKGFIKWAKNKIKGDKK